MTSMKSITVLSAAAVLAGVSGLAQANININWTDQATSGFDAQETLLINTAIGRWEAVIVSFGAGAVSNDFNISITETQTAFIGFVDDVVEQASGTPASAIMEIDDGTFVNGFSSWFYDPTPNDSSEYTSSAFDHYGAAPQNGSAGGAIDFLSVITHELGHALGFAEAYSLWDAATNDATGVLTYGSETIGLQGTIFGGALSHLDPDDAPFDLMLSAGTFPGPGGEPGGGGFGDRRLISALDLDILAAVYGYEVDYSNLGVVPAPGVASLMLLGGILSVGRRRR